MQIPNMGPEPERNILANPAPKKPGPSTVMLGIIAAVAITSGGLLLLLSSGKPGSAKPPAAQSHVEVQAVSATASSQPGPAALPSEKSVARSFAMNTPAPTAQPTAQAKKGMLAHLFASPESKPSPAPTAQPSPVEKPATTSAREALAKMPPPVVEEHRSVRVKARKTPKPEVEAEQAEPVAAKPVEAKPAVAAKPKATKAKPAAKPARSKRPTPPAFPMSFALEQTATESAEIMIFPAKGRALRTLKPETSMAGTQQLIWDGKDSQGNSLTAGTYYIRVRSAKSEDVQEIVIP